MLSKNTTLDLHKTLAHEIKAAKKTMFKRHREGQSLANSANTFLWDMQNRLHKILVETGQQPAERPMRLANRVPPVHVPIIGTVGEDGIKLFDEEHTRDVLTETEEEAAKAEARLIAHFLDGGPPDFLMEAMLAALDKAWEHVFGQPHDPHEDYSADNLEPLFMKTKMISWDQMWPDDDVETPEPRNEKVLEAMSELLNNPETPSDLYEAVAEFVCEATTNMHENVLHSKDSLTRMLNALPRNESVGARDKARAAGA